MMEKLWTTSEVARYLEIDDQDVERLVQEGQLTGYRLGGRFVRFRPDQVKALKGRLAPRREDRAAIPQAESWRARTWDFIYFYDFYVISAGLLAVLILYLISGS